MRLYNNDPFLCNKSNKPYTHNIIINHNQMKQ